MNAFSFHFRFGCVLALLRLADASPATPFPPPPDVPAGPDGVEAPGGAHLPVLRGTAAADSPAFGMITDSVAPDETLVATGAGLQDATLEIWAEGGLRSVTPLASDDSRLLAVIPKDMPRSTMLVWPVRNGLRGAPIRINGPVASWISPARLFPDRESETLRIMGRNLALDGPAPRVYCEGPGFKGFLDVIHAGPYCLDVRPPSDPRPGSYTVQTHNGTGEAWGWSEPRSFEIALAAASASPERFPVDKFGAIPDDGRDDTAAIQRAVDAAGRAGGGIVEFKAGTYGVTTPIVIRDPDIRIMGAGAGEFDKDRERPVGTFTAISAPADGPWPDAILDIRAPRCDIRRLHLRNNTTGEGQNVISVHAPDARIEHVSLASFDRRNWGHARPGPPPFRPPTLLGDSVDAYARDHLRPAPGLAGYWSFDGPEETIAVDLSGHGRHGRGRSCLVKGEFGQAIASRRGFHLVLPDAPDGTPRTALTLSVWFKLEDLKFTRLRTLIRKEGAYALRFDGERLGGVLWLSGRVVRINMEKRDWRTDRWHHVALVFDGRAVRLFLDGEPAADRSLTEPAQIDDSSAVTCIGTPDEGADPFQGLLDEIRIHGRALSGSDIRAEFDAEAPRRQSVAWEPLNPAETGSFASRELADGIIEVLTEGPANLVFRNSLVHCVGPGVLIGALKTSGALDEPASTDVLVSRVQFVGHYAGEPDGLSRSASSGRAVAVCVGNGKRVMMEDCDITSAGRAEGRVMNRTVLSLNSANRWLHFRNNRSIDIGPHPSVTGMNRNQGEQYLFHFRYAPGGLFDVTAATADTLTLSTADIRPLPRPFRGHGYWNRDGGIVHDEIGENRHWILFISKGRGAGQYREVTGKQPAGTDGWTLSTDRPWRVVPDSTSRVNLFVAQRDIIVHDCTADIGIPTPTHKTHGVTFWYETFDTIVAGCVFRNMTSGVIYNSKYRSPVAWNLVRDNRVEHIAGTSGDTSETPAAFVSHFRTYGSEHLWYPEADRVWYEAGNAFRSNEARDCDLGAYLHTRAPRPATPAPHADAGMMMCVIEHTTMRDVRRGIVLSAPIHWCVVRNNTIETSDPETPILEWQDRGEESNFIMDNTR